MADVTDASPNNLKKGPAFGTRHLQAVLLFLHLVVALICRFSVSVCIVVMTNAAKSNPDFPEYNWNEKEKSYIISSFYWGYIINQIPSGYWVRRYGVKINLFMSAFGAGLLSLIVPWCVSSGSWQFYCVIRFLQGFLQGVLHPATFQHLAKWSPPVERNRLGAFVLSAFDFGTAIAMALPGLISNGPLGWPGTFYAVALLSFVLCAVWLVFGANDATTSKFITLEERNYISSTLKLGNNIQKSAKPTPWRAILTSKPFYALIMVKSAVYWGYTTLVTELPSYMNGVLDFYVKENALYNALIFLICGFISYAFIFLADIIMKRKLMSLTYLRKSFNSFGTWIPAAGLIWLGFLGPEHKHLAVALMTSILAINSATIIGTSLSAIDLSPNHAAILTSLLNSLASLAQVLAPLFAGIVVKDEHSRSQWQIVFAASAFIFCAGDTFFLIWGTAKEQPWNDPYFLQQPDERKKGDSSEAVKLQTIE